MADTKYTSREKEAAEEIEGIILGVGIGIENMATIINRQVVVPLQAKIDRLEAEKEKLKIRCELLETETDEWAKGAIPAGIKMRRLEAEKAELVEALREITKREGPYSRDPLTHAGNTIEDMAGIAEAAIAKADLK